MSWKTDLQLRDIDEGQRLEAKCRRCGHTHYVDITAILKSPELQFIYIDELERMTVCKARGCGGAVRLAQVHDSDTEGFVGGMS